MRRLLELSFGFPTVVFTTMLLLSLTYWVFAVLAGRIDLEVESEIDIEGGGDIGDGGATSARSHHCSGRSTCITCRSP